MALTPGRYRNVRVAACSVGVVAGLFLVALSLLPGKPIYPGSLVAVLFVAVFPLFGWAVIERAVAQSRRPPAPAPVERFQQRQQRVLHPPVGRPVRRRSALPASASRRRSPRRRPVGTDDGVHPQPPRPAGTCRLQLLPR